MAAWLGLIGALIGAAIGGFATYKVAMQQFTNERRAEARRLRLAAMEEIYLLLSKSAMMAKELFETLIGTLHEAPAGGTERNPLLTDAWNERLLELERLSMLIGLYAPSLRSDYEQIQSMLVTMVTSVRRASTADPLLRGAESDLERTSKTEHVFEAVLNMITGAQEKLSREIQMLDDGS